MNITKNNISNLKSEDLKTIDLQKYPITTNAFTWTPMGIFLYVLLNILSILLPSVFILTFFDMVLRANFSNSWLVIRLFIDIFAWWGTYILTSLILGKLVLVILTLIHKPKEGLFQLDVKDKDYYFYCLRITVKKFILWIWNNFCFPWASNFALKWCNIKIDFKSTMFDGWTDLEFIDYGKNIMLGQGAVVLSSMIIGDHLLVKKVVVGDHVVIGGNAIVAPGTIIGKGTTLGAWATTHVGQILEPDWIYVGSPAKKYQPANKMIEDNKKNTVRRIVDTGERIEFKK